MNNSLFTVMITSLMLPLTSLAQGHDEPLAQKIEILDSLFWQAYNTCEVEDMLEYIADDFEFYHDKNGLTRGKETFGSMLSEALCGSSEYRIRREAIPSSITIHPLPGHGAIIDGEHLFYETMSGGTEQLTGKAVFTHVWEQKGDTWQMTRVLSFGHQPAHSEPTDTQPVSHDLLSPYIGKYEGAQTGTIQVSATDGTLSLSFGDTSFTLFYQGEHTFRMSERPVSFTFILDDSGQVSGFQVVENNEVVESATRIGN